MKIKLRDKPFSVLWADIHRDGDISIYDDTAEKHIYLYADEVQKLMKKLRAKQ